MVTTVRRLVARAFAAWEQFLFGKTDALPLAFLRVVFGSYLVYYYVALFPFLSLHHFPPGLVPPAALEGPNLLELVRYGTVPRFAVYLLTLAAAAALAAGLQTRLAAALCWLLNHAWMDPIAAGRNSGDNVVSVFCFLFLVASIGGHAQRVLSLDARFRSSAHRERSIPAWPLRLFQVQLVYIYFFSGFHKLASHDWYAGEALFYVFQQRGWSRFDLSWLTHPVPVGLITYGTLLFELLIFPVLVWAPSLRPIVLLAGVCFHLGIAVTMRVFVFGEIMPIAYLSFVDPSPFLAWVSGRFGELAHRARAWRLAGTGERRS